VHLLHEFLCMVRALPESEVNAVLLADYRAAGGRSRLNFEAADSELPPPRPRKTAGAVPSRQARHLQS
jgi:hypothetical protein